MIHLEWCCINKLSYLRHQNKTCRSLPTLFCESPFSYLTRTHTHSHPDARKLGKKNFNASGGPVRVDRAWSKYNVNPCPLSVSKYLCIWLPSLMCFQGASAGAVIYNQLMKWLCGSGQILNPPLSIAESKTGRFWDVWTSPALICKTNWDHISVCRKKEREKHHLPYNSSILSQVWYSSIDREMK